MPTEQKTGRPGSIIKVIVILLAILVGIIIIYLVVGPTTTDRKSEKDMQSGAKEGVGGDDAARANYTKPSVTKALFQFVSMDNIDTLRIVAETTDPNNVPVTLLYEWTINGQQSGSTANSLSGFKKGDRVVAKITPYNGKEYGLPRTINIEISNTTPKILENKTVQFEGNVMKYQVKASDDDGDPLQYLLVEGPKGAAIDKQTGLVTWPVKKEDTGVHKLKVKITDGRGGEAEYPFTVNLSAPTDEGTVVVISEKN